MLSHGWVRSLPTPINTLFDLVEDETGPRPVNLDEDILGPSKPFIIPNILEPTKSTHDDLHAAVSIS